MGNLIATLHIRYVDEETFRPVRLNLNLPMQSIEPEAGLLNSALCVLDSEYLPPKSLNLSLPVGTISSRQINREVVDRRAVSMILPASLRAK